MALGVSEVAAGDVGAGWEAEAGLVDGADVWTGAVVAGAVVDGAEEADVCTGAVVDCEADVCTGTVGVGVVEEDGCCEVEAGVLVVASGEPGEGLPGEGSADGVDEGVGACVVDDGCSD